MRMTGAVGRVTAVAATITLTACSSSGGGVSTSQLESKLKKEPAIQQVISQGGKKAQVTDKLVNCIAKALVKNASPSDLSKYVNGKMNLNDIGGKAKGSANDARTEAKTCAENSLQGGK